MWQEEFKTILKEEFDKRKNADSSYSLNRFAKLAGVSVGTMSELFNAKREWKLTGDRAADIIARIPLAVSKRNQVLVSLGKPPELKKCLIESSQFEFLVNWKHQAVVMALDLPLDQRTPEKLCQRFLLTAEELDYILAHSLTHGLVEKDDCGLFQRVKKFWSSQDGISNEILRQHQVNNIELIKRGVQHISVKDRDCATMTFVGSRKRLDLVRKELRAVMERVNALMSVEEENDEVYLMTVGLIPLSSPASGETP